MLFRSPVRISTMCGYQDRAAGWLERALTTESLAGQQDLVGGHGDPFWLRWIRAVAEQRADLPLLHAECYVRLGLLLAGQGHVEPARKSLETACEMDPANVRGFRTLTELYWVSGERGRAADFLHRHLVDLPFDFDARNRLAAMWRDSGKAAQADALDRESDRMQRALVVPDFARPGAV